MPAGNAHNAQANQASSTGAAALDRARLAKVLGLLGSAHDGEVLAAAQQAEQMRRAAALTWQEIISAPGAAKDPKVEEIFRNTKAAVWFCLDHHPDLTDWESKFLWSLVGHHRPLSRRQQTVLDQLVAKARFARERAA